MKSVRQGGLVYCCILDIVACWHRFNLLGAFCLDAEPIATRGQQTVYRNLKKGKLEQDGRIPLESRRFSCKEKENFTKGKRNILQKWDHARTCRLPLRAFFRTGGDCGSNFTGSLSPTVCVKIPNCGCI
jgi:hypothetical protein